MCAQSYTLHFLPILRTDSFLWGGSGILWPVMVGIMSLNGYYKAGLRSYIIRSKCRPISKIVCKFSAWLGKGGRRGSKPCPRGESFSSAPIDWWRQEEFHSPNTSLIATAASLLLPLATAVVAASAARAICACATILLHFRPRNFATLRNGTVNVRRRHPELFHRLITHGYVWRPRFIHARFFCAICSFVFIRSLKWHRHRVSLHRLTSGK